MSKIIRGTLVRFEWHDATHEGRVVSSPSDTEVRVQLKRGSESDLPWTLATYVILHVDNVTVDRLDLHKRYMASLWDLGIQSLDRKNWQAKLNLPESTKEFSLADYYFAIETLVSDARFAYLKACREQGREPEIFGLGFCEGEPIFTIKDYAAAVSGLTGENIWNGLIWRAKGPVRA